MLVPALLRTLLVLLLTRHTLQGGVSPQNGALGRILPVRGAVHGMGRVKPGGVGPLGAMGALGPIGHQGYGSKPGKAAAGHFLGAHLGGGAYRGLGTGTRGVPKHAGRYGNLGGYGPSLGMGTGLGTGLPNGIGMGLGHGNKRIGGHGAAAGVGYPGTRQGYIGGAGNYLGASPGTRGFGAGLGQGGYPLGGGAGKFRGFGDGAGEYPGAGAMNGFTGYGNGYGPGSNGYGAALGYPGVLADGAGKGRKTGKSEGRGPGGFTVPGQGTLGSPGSGPGGAGATQSLGLGSDSGLGALGEGIESLGGKYAGGIGQVPYGGAQLIPSRMNAGGVGQVPYGGVPLVPSRMNGDGGYPYGAQYPGHGADAAKSASKYGAGGEGYPSQQAGFAGQLGTGQDPYGGLVGKYGRLNGFLGNGYKG